MNSSINFKHLHYFWVVAREGSMTRAAERLDVAVQTISGQLALLEQNVGKALFAQTGRKLVLTEAGRLALDYADQIFLLGQQLQDKLTHFDPDPALHLTVGLSDSMAKLIAFNLLQAVFALPQPVRLSCFEGAFEPLLADLALHKLDVVLTDRPPEPGTKLKVFSHPLGEWGVSLYGSPALLSQYGGDFPNGLKEAPMLLPTPNHALRSRMDSWFAARDITPKIVGEFEDSALLMTFGRSGLGLFPAPTSLAADVAAQFGAQPLGEMSGVTEQFYAISNERRIRHAAVEALCAGR